LRMLRTKKSSSCFFWWEDKWSAQCFTGSMSESFEAFHKQAFCRKFSKRPQFFRVLKFSMKI
jgi:hypothetical protein